MRSWIQARANVEICWLLCRAEKMIKDGWHSFSDAIRLLTIVPMPDSGKPARPAMMAWFPAAGFFIGSILIGLEMIFRSVLPDAAVLTSLLFVSSWLILTRGLHVDGLADTFDALGAVADRERRLQILRDPHTGPMGTAAVAIVIAGKILALNSLDGRPHIRHLSVLFACVFSRWMIVLACSMFSYARKEGLGAAFVGRAGWTQVVLASFLPLAMFVIFKISPSPLLPAALVTGLGIAFVAQRAFGGLTGDVLGAIVETVECVLLNLFQILTP